MSHIVMIPGATSDPSVWDYQVRALSGMKCQVIDHTDLDSIAAMAERVLAVAPDQFVLCGTSMGGYAALEVVRRAPERILKLILCNTNARADTPERVALRKKEIAAGEANYVSERMRDDYFFTFLSKKSAGDKNLIVQLRDIALRLGYDCFARHQTACMNRSDSLGILHKLNMPVLVVGGREDNITPAEQQEEILRLVPHAIFKLFDDCGHIAHMEKRAELTNAIRDFVEQEERKRFYA